MLQCILDYSIEVSALMLHIEVWMRSIVVLYPVVGDDADVSIADEFLAKYVGAMVCRGSD